MSSQPPVDPHEVGPHRVVGVTLAGSKASAYIVEPSPNTSERTIGSSPRLLWRPPYGPA